MAWIRTGVALMGLGFLIAKFSLFLHELAMLRGGAADALALPEGLLPDHTVLPAWIGGAIVIAGAMLTLLAGLDHVRMLRRLRVDDFIGSRRRYISGALALLVAAIGLLLAVYLLLL